MLTCGNCEDCDTAFHEFFTYENEDQRHQENNTSLAFHHLNGSSLQHRTQLQAITERSEESKSEADNSSSKGGDSNSCQVDPVSSEEEPPLLAEEAEEPIAPPLLVQTRQLPELPTALTPTPLPQPALSQTTTTLQELASVSETHLHDQTGTSPTQEQQASASETHLHDQTGASPTQEQQASASETHLRDQTGTSPTQEQELQLPVSRSNSSQGSIPLRIDSLEEERKNQAKLREKKQLLVPLSKGDFIPNNKFTMVSLTERDFDVDPTDLYAYLQKKEWAEVITVLADAPEEAKIWVYRKEPSGARIRWRLLPLHGSIIFQAPPEVVESLLTVFPEGAAERDDEGSLPIHLAYKRGATEPVVKLLLDAFPGSIDVADRKGRTPKQLAASSTGSSKHRDFVHAMKNHLLSQRAARVQARAEERQKYSSQLDEAKEQHKQEMETMMQTSGVRIEELEQQVTALQVELRESQEASQVLVEHVGSVEKRLEEQVRTSQTLTNTVQTLEGQLSAANAQTVAIKEEAQTQANVFTSKIMESQSQVQELLNEKAALSGSLDKLVDAAKAEKQALMATLNDRDAEVSELKETIVMKRRDIEGLKARLEEQVAETDAQKAKIVQITETYGDSATSLEATQHQVMVLEKERSDLHRTVADLTTKLRTVATFLKEMSDEQDAVIQQATVHEAEMEQAAMEHAIILESVKKQQELDEQTHHTRLIFAKLLQDHDDIFARNTSNRKNIVESIQIHTETLADGARKRTELVKNVRNLQEQLEKTRRSVAVQEPSYLIAPEEAGPEEESEMPMHEKDEMEALRDVESDDMDGIVPPSTISIPEGSIGAATATTPKTPVSMTAESPSALVSSPQRFQQDVRQDQEEQAIHNEAYIAKKHEESRDAVPHEGMAGVPSSVAMETSPSKAPSMKTPVELQEEKEMLNGGVQVQPDSNAGIPTTAE